MANFPESRLDDAAADEILDMNVLTLGYLRSLIAGDFYLGVAGEDILLLHEKGIFLLRQCHQTGMILGKAEQAQWTDLNYLGHGRQFPNPMSACEESIRHLMQILKLPRANFVSCVIFDAQSELRSVPTDVPLFRFLRTDQLEAFFAEFPQRPVRYCHTQLQALYDIFLIVTAAQ